MDINFESNVIGISALFKRMAKIFCESEAPKTLTGRQFLEFLSMEQHCFQWFFIQELQETVEEQKSNYDYIVSSSEDVINVNIDELKRKWETSCNLLSEIIKFTKDGKSTGDQK